MGKYRNDKVEQFMEKLEDEITAIVSKEFGNLDVAGVMKKHRTNSPDMTIEDAVILAMRGKAAGILRSSIAMAISLDRVSVMVDQMADEMGEDGNQNGERYRERLSLLLDFGSIIKELR